MMRKKPGIILLFTIILTCFAFQGFAQESFKAAVIDSVKAFESSEEGQKAISQLREKEQKIKNELSKLDSQAQALEKKLYTQKFTLTPESQQQLASDLDRIRTERKRLEEDSIKDYRRLEFSIFGKIKAEMFPIIEDVAKERGYSVVFDLSVGGVSLFSPVAYFNPAIDITEEVTKRYNALKANRI